jgi:hypothetical protein
MDLRRLQFASSGLSLTRPLAPSARRSRAEGRLHGVVLVGVRRKPDPKKEFEKTVATFSAMFHERLRVWQATENGFADFVSQSLAP